MESLIYETTVNHSELHNLDNLEISIADPNTKCGLIFYEKEKLTYFCIYCEKIFENSKYFESHMFDKHIPNLCHDSLSKNEDKKEIIIENKVKFEIVSNNDIIDINYKDDGNNDIIKLETEECDLKSSLTCEYCAKILKNQNSYNIHIKMNHTNLGSFRCNLCGHSMKTLLNLENHMKRLHKNKDDPIYQCNFCELGFKTASRLTLHVHKIHTLEKTFSCKECGKNFMNMGNLKIHERIHTGEKPFQCEICGKKFIRSNNLDIHTRRHLSHRNIKCELCDKMFYTRTSMADHLISHTHEKNFSCDYCSTKFARKGDKVKHIKMKHAQFMSEVEKKYVCKICSADFALRVSFRQHMKSQHGVTLSNLINSGSLEEQQNKNFNKTLN